MILGARSLRWGPSCVAAIAGVAGLALALTSGVSAHAQPRDNNPAGGIDLGARGGFGWGGPIGDTPTQERSDSPIEFSARAGFVTDYIYRGTTLSAHQPAVGAAFEATYSIFYAGATMASVKLPTLPAAELTTTAGIRPKLGNVDFDLSVTRFYYPGETVAPGEFAGIEYWESVIRADTSLGELLRVAAGFAYSPNVSNTGAWSKYAAFGLGLDLPRRVLPQDVSVSVTGGAGYFWFGNQSAALGGFPLPAYLNWNAGVTVSRKAFNFDLRYYNTNLSKEDCFVFTGDPTATPGGRPDPITNPEGLMSRWCSATVVAKFWFAFN
jgi:uncharacterized protein (TIGR02001 family)